MTMKTKSIIFAVFGAALLGFTSCEGMLSTKSSIVMFEDDHEFDEPTDTVYSVLGIIQKMQKIADRTVLFGELRGDLTSLNGLASKDLQEISNFSTTVENKYNNPIDYYAVINNCNYFLAHADTAKKMNQDYIFRKEYGVVLSYRAWAYLKLAEAYGKVPFVTKPITNGADADAALYDILDIRQIADKLIPELEGFVDEELPDYGGIDAFAKSTLFFLPTRLILGELCLWAGGQANYEKAARYYHDYLYRVGHYVTTGREKIWWTTENFISYYDQYSSLFGTQSALQEISYIPMESDESKGITSELVDIFTSTKKNQYFFKAGPSQAIRDLSASQKFCFYEGISRSIYYLNPESIDNELEKGDLRLASIYEIDNDIEDENLSDVFNTSKQNIRKFNASKICIFRRDLVYLRFAEALNYAGYPEAAFAVLKYGLADQWWENRDDYISQDEKERAARKGDFLSFPWYGSGQGFRPFEISMINGAEIEETNTMGIHSRGCGLAEKDTSYVLRCRPDTLSDEYLNMDEAGKLAYRDAVRAQQMEEVERYLIDELALETMFEGNRFGDLIRFSMHRGDREGVYSDNAFLAEKVAARNGAAKVDESLKVRLIGSNPTGYNANWYLPLP